MTQDSIDPRVLRTRNLLKEALIELSTEKSFDAVTVGNIARRANVNRATFYRHYPDKFGLVEEIFQEAIGQMRRDLKPPGPGALHVDPQDPPERWVNLFEHFAEHKRMYQALLGKNGSTWFAARMRDQISTFIEQREQLRDQLSEFDRNTSGIDIPRTVAITLGSNLIMSTVSWWLEYGKEYSPQQMASWFLEFVLHGYVGVLGL